MAANELSIWISLITQIGSIFIGFIVVLWAVNKLWLSSIYVQKSELDSLKEKLHNDIKDNVTSYEKTQSDVQKIDRDFAVFKEKYNGDSSLLKEQMSNQKDLTKEILHKINNILSLNFKAIISEAIDDKINEK